MQAIRTHAVREPAQGPEYHRTRERSSHAHLHDGRVIPIPREGHDKPAVALLRLPRGHVTPTEIGLRVDETIGRVPRTLHHRTSNEIVDLLPVLELRSLLPMPESGRGNVHATRLRRASGARCVQTQQKAKPEIRQLNNSLHIPASSIDNSRTAKGRISKVPRPWSANG